MEGQPGLGARIESVDKRVRDDGESLRRSLTELDQALRKEISTGAKEGLTAARRRDHRALRPARRKVLLREAGAGAAERNAERRGHRVFRAVAEGDGPGPAGPFRTQDGEGGWLLTDRTSASDRAPRRERPEVQPCPINPTVAAGSVPAPRSHGSPGNGK
jgi:hypothetical protein